MKETTLVLIKPDAVQRGLVGEIIKRFEQVGMKLVGMKMVWVDKEFSKEHYKDHVGKPFYEGLEKYISSGPVVALAIEGIHAVRNVRKIVGPTGSDEAAPGTIRGDYGHMSLKYADDAKKTYTNIIHASDEKSAKREVKLWFSDVELHTYKTVHEVHTL